MSGGSSGGSGTGSSANVYEPAAQGTADYNWNQILQPLINQAANAGAGTPGGIYYPQAQSATQNYITQNPSASEYYGTSQLAPSLGSDVNATAGQDINSLQTDIGQLSSLNPSLTANAFNPQYGADVGAAGLSGPAYGTAMAGSNQAASAGQGLMGAANQVLSTGFDPQQALYNQQSSNALNQQNAINAMSGIAGTPYGAGVTGQNQQLFNQNWLNQQLGRQQGALSSAAPAYAAGQTLTQAPLSTQNNQLSVLNQLLNSQNSAGALGANALAGNAGAAGSAATNSYNLGSGGLNTLLAAGQAPYSASQTIGTNDLTALGNLINIGNSQYQLPQSVLGNLQSYMGLGQSASSTANQIDAAQNNQLASIGSGLGTAGSLGLGAYNAGLFGSAAAPAAASLLIPGTDTAIAGGSAATGLNSALGLGALGSG